MDTSKGMNMVAWSGRHQRYEQIWAGQHEQLWAGQHDMDKVVLAMQHEHRCQKSTLCTHINITAGLSTTMFRMKSRSWEIFLTELKLNVRINFPISAENISYVFNIFIWDVLLHIHARSLFIERLYMHVSSLLVVSLCLQYDKDIHELQTKVSIRK